MTLSALQTWVPTELPRCTPGGNDIQLSKRKTQKNQHHNDKDGPIRLECRQLTDPCAADAESKQDQRRDAAKEPAIAAEALAHNCLVVVCKGCSLHHVLRYGVNYE